MVSPTKQSDAKDVFLAHLATIDRIIASIARRHAMAADEADDFASWIKTKLIENDYAVLQKFQGRSSIGTYLTVVVANLFRDYRTQLWGRWRPSAMAKRLGGVAVRLETLLYRDGHPLDQAIAVLRSAGVVGMTDRQLSELAARLPARVRVGKADEAGLESAEAEQWADSELWLAEQTQDREAAHRLLERALANLPPHDQLILRLRYWEGFTVAEIARALQIDQKPLYRRIENNLEHLRTFLEAEGLNRTCVAALLFDDVAT